MKNKNNIDENEMKNGKIGKEKGKRAGGGERKKNILPEKAACLKNEADIWSLSAAQLREDAILSPYACLPSLSLLPSIYTYIQSSTLGETWKNDRQDRADRDRKMRQGTYPACLPAGWEKMPALL